MTRYFSFTHPQLSWLLISRNPLWLCHIFFTSLFNSSWPYSSFLIFMSARVSFRDSSCGVLVRLSFLQFLGDLINLLLPTNDDDDKSVFFTYRFVNNNKKKSYIYFIPFLDRNKYETSLSKFKISLRQGTTKFIWKQSQTRLSAHVIFKVCKKDTISCTGHEILIRERRSLFIIDF